MGKSKKGVGILLCMFLGLLGLIIGVLLYPSGSYERTTFIKGWLTWVVVLVLLIVAAFVCLALFS